MAVIRGNLINRINPYEIPSIPPGARILKTPSMQDKANLSMNGSNPYSNPFSIAPSPVVRNTATTQSKPPPQYITTTGSSGYRNPYTGKGGSFTTQTINPAYIEWQKSQPGYVEPMTDAQRLTSEFQAAQDEAKAANEARYSEIRSDYEKQRADYEKRLATGMGFLENAGVQQSKDITASWEQQKGKGAQNLASAGFYNSTIMPTMQMGYETQKQADLARLNESINQQKLQTYGQLSGDALSSNQRYLNFKENRTDTYPDMNLYNQLMQQYGQTTAGSGSTTGFSGPMGTSIRVNMNPQKTTGFTGKVEATRQYRNSPSAKTTISPSVPVRYSAPKKKTTYPGMIDKSFRGNKKYYAQMPGQIPGSFKIY